MGGAVGHRDPVRIAQEFVDGDRVIQGLPTFGWVLGAPPPGAPGTVAELVKTGGIM